ncbi:hypothetical protein YC2023_116333 [Brassica napus]
MRQIAFALGFHRALGIAPLPQRLLPTTGDLQAGLSSSRLAVATAASITSRLLRVQVVRIDVRAITAALLSSVPKSRLGSSSPELCPFYFQNIDYQNLESEHVVSFIKVLLKFTKTLEKVVVRLACYIDGRGFEELLGMVSMLSHEYNVSIVLSSTCRIKGRSLECY